MLQDDARVGVVDEPHHLCVLKWLPIRIEFALREVTDKLKIKYTYRKVEIMLSPCKSIISSWHLSKSSIFKMTLGSLRVVDRA